MECQKEMKKNGRICQAFIASLPASVSILADEIANWTAIKHVPQQPQH
jgi:hypothetical protein